MKKTEQLADWQAQTNTQLWKEILKLGRLTDICEKTSLNRQTFYNIRDNRSFVSMPTVLLLKSAYPQVDWDEATSVEKRVVTPPPTQLDALQKDLILQNMRLTDRLLEQNTDLTRELPFLFASSQATATRHEIGFHACHTTAKPVFCRDMSRIRVIGLRRLSQ